MDEIGDVEGMEDFSMDDLEKDLKKGRGGRRWLWFLIGLTFGVGGTIAAPRYLASYLPESLRGNREILTGPVIAEERTGDRVLLTIAAEPGALIASFSERVDEIALLVEPGDIVTIAVPDYEPFVENPDFEGVKKGPGKPESRDEDDEDSETGDEVEAGDDQEDSGDDQEDGSSTAESDEASEESAAVAESADGAAAADTTATGSGGAT